MLKFYQNNTKITKDESASSPSKLSKKDEFKSDNGNFAKINN